MIVTAWVGGGASGATVPGASIGPPSPPFPGASVPPPEFEPHAATSRTSDSRRNIFRRYSSFSDAAVTEVTARGEVPQHARAGTERATIGRRACTCLTPRPRPGTPRRSTAPQHRPHRRSASARRTAGRPRAARSAAQRSASRCAGSAHHRPTRARTNRNGGRGPVHDARIASPYTARTSSPATGCSRYSDGAPYQHCAPAPGSFKDSFRAPGPAYEFACERAESIAVPPGVTARSLRGSARRFDPERFEDLADDHLAQPLDQLLTLLDRRARRIARVRRFHAHLLERGDARGQLLREADRH